MLAAVEILEPEQACVSQIASGEGQYPSIHLRLFNLVNLLQVNLVNLLQGTRLSLIR